MTLWRSAWSRRDGKQLRKSFRTLAEAKAWRHDAASALRRGTLRASRPTTLRQAWDAWLAGAKDGSVRTRSGDTYKPSAVRSYASAMEMRVLDELGVARLSDISRTDLQDLADKWLAEGLDPSTIRNQLMPLRVLFRRAVARGEVTINPTTSIELPAVRGRRDRIASPEEAAELIAALPVADRALWAVMLYAGLRRGEVMALEWESIDFAEGVIRVTRGWDVREGPILPKSSAGRRSVPIPSVLRGLLLGHRLRSGRSSGLAFGRSATRTFNHTSVLGRAATAWKTENKKRAARELPPLQPIGMHECRHTFASLMIAAGVNAKALSTYMGHSTITITLDRYGHLMPGNEAEAAGLLDAYLSRAANARTNAHEAGSA